ncbi:MAG: DUF4861 family protein [Spirochaetales bacterium]|nr:DUF4861 family protein [Spirochaetales bacterium]
MSKNKLSIILLSLVLVFMLISCSNNTPGASATGLLVGRVGTVFADPNYKYDVAYKNGSTRYIADVTVSLSNGSYTYPSSVKGELLKFDGSNWISVQKNITEQIVFSESGTYKVKYTADGFTADTGEFPVYKPGELYNFAATKPVYAEGSQMVKTDFTYTYCYKDESGSIGLTNSLPQDKVSIYTRDEHLTFITLLDDQDMYKSSENKVYAGILIESPDTPKGYINKEIEIQVKSDCKTDIKSLAYYKLKKGTTNEYEFSGNIYKRFKDDDEKIIGRTVILSKTDDKVKKAEGFSIEISDLIQTESTITLDKLKEEYNKEGGQWSPTDTFNTKEYLDGPGYILLRITEKDKEITKDNPSYGYIRVRK